MPELPEVETSRRGIAPHLEGKNVKGAIIRQPRLRWSIPSDLNDIISGQTLHRVKRRAKYLLLEMDSGHLIMHLGMSGSLRILPPETTPGPHDHFDLLVGDCCLRLCDPRRFGAVLWSDQPLDQHPLLTQLGPEPLGDTFTAEYLFGCSRGRRLAIKSFIMNSKMVVGVGNIYASESLFLAGIHPQRAAQRISLARYKKLVTCIQDVLSRAIQQGGTTLRDFQHEDGKPGYFTQELLVYGQEGKLCTQCNNPITQRRIGQRSSFYCKKCQR